MPSNTPKPNARSRRRRPSATEAPAEGRRFAPRLPRSCDWPEIRREWWRRVWRSPLGATWDDVLDYEAVYRLGVLYELVETQPVTAAILAQVSRLESELGLTPAARKRQYVHLPKPPTKTRSRPEPGTGWDDLRVTDEGGPTPPAHRRMRAVDPSFNGDEP